MPNADACPMNIRSLVKNVKVPSLARLMSLKRYPFVKNVKVDIPKIPKVMKTYPQSLAQQLRKLHLKSEYFNCKNGGVDLNIFRDCINLKMLIISVPMIDNFEIISRMKNLRFIVIKGLGNHEIKSLDPISDLMKLKVLKFSLFSIRDLSPLKNLKNLKELSIDGNASDLTPLQGLTHLHNLKIIMKKTMTDFSPIQHLENLRFLKFVDRFDERILENAWNDEYLKNMKYLTGENFKIDN